MASVFWLMVFLIAYPLVIYPWILWLWRSVAAWPVRRQSCQPMVTVMIAAYNEKDCIEATLVNKLEQDYPADKLDIVVISDDSDDGTEQVVEKFQGGRVRLLRQAPRSGKASALNMGMRYAKGEIVVFSDANSIFAKDAIARLVENFADPEVGYVTGTLTYQTQGGVISSKGCGAYMKYENKLRELESDFHSIIGVNGGIDAVRKSLYNEIPPSLITDFVLPLHVISIGRRVIYDKRATNYEVPNENVEAEFRMRVRVALRALQGLVYMSKLLNPLRYPRIAFSIVSHKWLRYLAPVFMIAALVSNVILAFDGGVYGALLLLQLLIYGLGILGVYVNVSGPLSGLTVFPAYFLLSNTAFLLAIYKFCRGEKMAIWEPRVG